VRGEIGCTCIAKDAEQQAGRISSIPILSVGDDRIEQFVVLVATEAARERCYQIAEACFRSPIAAGVLINVDPARSEVGERFSRNRFFELVVVEGVYEIEQ
jgi:hypothetical protein